MAAPSKTRNIHNYILAALGGTLAATTIVIIISAIFSPAHISFFVTHASRSNQSDGVRLNLTISATTSQHRTKVKYESIFIDLLNSTKPTGRDKFHAEVDATWWPKDYVNFSSPTTFNASALLVVNSDLIEDFAGSQVDNRGLTVEVMAQVHFEVGKARSRLYGIKVFCYGVRFADYRQNSTATPVPISCG